MTTDSRLERVAAGTLVGYPLFLVALVAAQAVLDAAIRDEPMVLIALFASTVGIVAGAVLLRWEQLRAGLVAPAARGESIWDEVILFAGLLVVLVLGLGFALSELPGFETTGESDPTVVLLAVGTTTAILTFRRLDWIPFPDWLVYDEWRVWEYLTLLVALFFGTVFVTTPVFGPTGTIPAVVGLVAGLVAVSLRRRGVFVEKPTETDAVNRRGH